MSDFVFQMFCVAHC